MGSRRYFRAGMIAVNRHHSALNRPTRPEQAVSQVLQGMRMSVWMRTEEERI
jgi:hypothetical protein